MCYNKKNKKYLSFATIFVFLFLDLVYSEAFKESIKDSIPELLKQGTSEDCDRFVTMVEAIKDFDIYEKLGNIKCPVLVLCDENPDVKEQVKKFCKNSFICNVKVFDS